MPFTHPYPSLSAYGCPACLLSQGEALPLMPLAPSTDDAGALDFVDVDAHPRGESAATHYECTVCPFECSGLDRETLPMARQGVDEARARYTVQEGYHHQHAAWAWGRQGRATTPHAYAQAGREHAQHAAWAKSLTDRLAALDAPEVLAEG